MLWDYVVDVRAPEFLTCPQHLTLDNEEGEGYSLVKLKPLEAFDNDASGTIKQTLTLKLLGMCVCHIYIHVAT